MERASTEPRNHGRLARWHGIPAGRALDGAERSYAVEAICRWVVDQYAPYSPPPSPR